MFEPAAMFDSRVTRPSTASRKRPGTAHYRRRLPSAALREDAALFPVDPPEPTLQGTQNSGMGSSAGSQLLLMATVCGPSRGIVSTCSTVVFRFMLKDAGQANPLANLILSCTNSPLTGTPSLPTGRVAPSTAAKSARQVAKRLCQEFKESGLSAPDRPAELSLPQLALFQDVLARCADQWSVRLRFCDSLEDERLAWQADHEPGQLSTVYLRELELLPTRNILCSDAADDMPGRPPEETALVAQQSELMERLSSTEVELQRTRCEAKAMLGALESLQPLMQELKRAMAEQERSLRVREHVLKQQFLALIRAAVERERALAELYADSQCWASTPLAAIIQDKGAVGHAAADNAAAAELFDVLGQDSFSILDVSDLAKSSESKQQSTRSCQHIVAKSLCILRRTLPEHVKPPTEAASIPHPAGNSWNSPAAGPECTAALLERPGSVMGVASQNSKEISKVNGQASTNLPRVALASKNADQWPSPFSQESGEPNSGHSKLQYVAMLLKRVLGGSDSEAFAGAKVGVSTSGKVATIRENLVRALETCQEVPPIATAVANCQQLAAEMAAPEQAQKCVFHTIHSDTEDEDDVAIPSDIASIPTELGSTPESQKSSNSPGCREGSAAEEQPWLQNQQQSVVSPCTPRPPSGAARPTRILSDDGVRVHPHGATVRTSSRGSTNSSTMHSGIVQSGALQQRTLSTRLRTARIRSLMPELSDVNG